MSEADRRLVAMWAADSADRVLGLFEAEAPGDSRPRDAIAALRAFARGELRVRQALRLAAAHAAAREVAAPAAVAAARAAGQAAATRSASVPTARSGPASSAGAFYARSSVISRPTWTTPLIRSQWGISSARLIEPGALVVAELEVDRV